MTLMKKVVVPISGMHCRSCEMLIEGKLSDIPEVKKSTASFRRGFVEIFYDIQRPNKDEIEEAIRSAGYAIGTSKQGGFISRNVSDYKDLGIAAFFLLGIYLLLKDFGFINLDVSGAGANPSGLWIVLLVGLTAGISTCMALVGGLVLGLSARHAELYPEASAWEKFRPHLFFNLGRIVTFALLGALLGLFGALFQLSSPVLGLITIVVGFVMLVMGIQLIEIFPWANRFKLTIPKSIGRLFGIKRQGKEYSHKGALVLGGLTFFLPCGFTQAMQLYAVSSGSFAKGAIIMGLFALGTAPGLLGIGGITSIAKGIFAKRFFKFAGILVILFAYFNVANGYNLTGWQLNGDTSESAGQETAVKDPNVVEEDNFQVVKMNEKSNGYSPNKFVIKKGTPVKWIINAEDPYSCAASITIPKLGISKRLKQGENIIEFTARETGTLKFSCSMGMYTGTFQVVDGVSNRDSTTSQENVGSTPTETPSATIKPESAQVRNSADEQVIKAIYTAEEDIQPNSFTVTVGQPVRFMVTAKEDGAGCMSSIMIPNLYNTPEPLVAGDVVEMRFTPKKTGEYPITCGMGMIRGILKVISSN